MFCCSSLATNRMPPRICFRSVSTYALTKTNITLIRNVVLYWHQLPVCVLLVAVAVQESNRLLTEAMTDLQYCTANYSNRAQQFLSDFSISFVFIILLVAGFIFLCFLLCVCVCVWCCSSVFRSIFQSELVFTFATSFLNLFKDRLSTQYMQQL